MFDKIKHFTKNDLPVLVRDVRALGLLVFLVIVLMISWSGVKVIQTNYQLQKQISALNQENNVDQLKNKNLALQNEYYNTDQYLELAARQNFGLAAPGEKELIVPKDVALAHAPELPIDQQPGVKPADKAPFFVRNLRSWRDFLLSPNSDDDLTNTTVTP